jgi:protein-S-isoprenylcysteine O-methyltransferase Ste14
MIPKAILRAVIVIALMGALLFLLAGTTNWLGAKLFLAAMGGGGLTMELWLAWADPALLKERTSRRTDKPKFERILLPLLNVLFFAWLAAMALDMRWHGTAQIPAWINFVGAAVILLGFLANLRVFRENTFAASIVRVQKERGHKVVTTGPYALVRHPLYGIGCFVYLAIPFTLGSWRGVAAVPVMILVMALRALAEERLLQRQLEGYEDYMAKVRYRFVPFVW